MNQGHHSMKTEKSIETVKAVPAIGGAVTYSITLNEVVAIATILYIALQIAYLIWKWRKEAKRG